MGNQSNAALSADKTGAGSSPGGKIKKTGMLPLSALLLVSLAANVILFLMYSRLEAYVRGMDVIYSESYFHYDSITVDSFKYKVAAGEEFVVIITRPGCPNCRMLEQPVIELAERKGISDKIYHLNVELLRRDSEIWAAFKETYGFEGTPTYARFAGGQQLSNVGWTYENGIEYAAVERWIEEQGDYWDR